MTEDYRKAISTMCDAVLESIRAIIARADFDKTFTATVSQKDSETKGRVFYNGLTYPFSSTLPFRGGDTVRVCAPCNNWDDLFLVENKSASKGGAT